MSQELRRWIDYKDRYVESDYLFCTKRGNPLRVEYFEKNFRQYGERVGLDVHPHMLRHNFAKRCLMAGMDIYTLSRILGHSSVITTEKTYLQLINKDDLRKNYAKYSPLTRLKKRW
jgi:integrase/recombinase XerD